MTLSRTDEENHRHYLFLFLLQVQPILQTIAKRPVKQDEGSTNSSTDLDTQYDATMFFEVGHCLVPYLES